ncbi:4Fe-4S binding protein [Desulfocurvus sp. DL9XJH121]
MAELTQLKEAVAKVLPEVKYVIAWQRGHQPLRSRPLFVRGPEDIEKMIWDETCTNNLASYLTSHRGEKIGIVVKGCDSRSVIELLQEKLIARDDVVLIGMPCTGMFSLNKIRARLDLSRLGAADWDQESLRIATRDGEEHSFPRDEVLADRCLSCAYPNPLAFDVHVGEPLEPWAPRQHTYARVQEFEKLPMDQRFEFWRREMNRCVRCYACRNACPLCVCKDHCIAESRQPHYQSQEADVCEKWFFQMIHAMHTAGRCTQCGACERACPMDIPVLLLKKKMAQVVEDLFEYEAGIDQTAVPPLLTFQLEERHIEEKKW